VRQVVPLCAVGGTVRVRLSNEYGTVPLHTDAASVVLRARALAVRARRRAAWAVAAARRSRLPQ
jgi:hypothetical protein